MTREQWLNQLKNALAPAFKAKGHEWPAATHLSCGYPHTGSNSKRIGECHYCEEDRREIFISPSRDENMDVAAIVLHELVHAALGHGKGHGKEFKALATSLGLAGPMRATHAGPDALALLTPILADLGPYPHKAISGHRAPRQPAARHAHLNLTCPECGFHAKVWVEQLDFGRLVCPADGSKLLTKQERG